MTTTAKTIQENLSVLSQYTDEELSLLSVSDLRRTLRNLGVKAVERGLELVPIRSARKEELVTAIQTALTNQRALNVAIIPTETDLTPTIELYTPAQVCEKLSQLTELPASQVQAEVSRLAFQVVEAISKACPDTSEQLRFNVRCNVRSKLLRDTLELAVASDIPGIRLVFDSFRQLVMDFTKNDTELKREAGQKRVDNFDENATEVNIEPLLAWAVDVLNKVPSYSITDTAKWKPIALALALVTGRRIYSEVLFADSQFTYEDDSHVTFTGQAKASEDEVDDIQQMTTLVPANLVIQATEWLARANKRQTTEGFSSPVKAREKSNSRFGKDLNAYFKQLKESFGLPESAKIHSLRKFYVLKCIESLEGDRQQGKEAARLLGHRDWRTASDNYTCEFRLTN